MTKHKKLAVSRLKLSLKREMNTKQDMSKKYKTKRMDMFGWVETRSEYSTSWRSLDKQPVSSAFVKGFIKCCFPASPFSRENRQKCQRRNHLNTGIILLRQLRCLSYACSLMTVISTTVWKRILIKGVLITNIIDDKYFHGDRFASNDTRMHRFDKILPNLFDGMAFHVFASSETKTCLLKSSRKSKGN